MNDMNINTREAYLEWRKNWKQEYKALSERIRDTKVTIKNQHREQGYADYTLWNRLRAGVSDANSALDTLKAAKQAVQQRYLQEQCAEVVL